MVLNPNKSNYQVQELATRWAKLFDETITNSYVLQCAIDGKFSLYTVNSGLRCVNLWVEAGLGRPSRKIVAYLKSEFIKLADFQIRELLCCKQMTIIFLNLSESDFIQGDESFDLSEIEAAILDENERIIIKPDDIIYLSVMVEDVIAFERELRRMSNEHQATANAQNGALKLAETEGNYVAGSQSDTTPNQQKPSNATEPATGYDKCFTRNQIKLIFNKLDSEQWRGYFSREYKNGLLVARQGKFGQPEYLLEEISNWLKQKGYYTEADIKSAIKKYNEPPVDNTQPNKTSPKINTIGTEFMNRMK